MIHLELLSLEDVLLHAHQVDLVVELDDIHFLRLRIRIVEKDFDENPSNIFRLNQREWSDFHSIYFFVRFDDLVEEDNFDSRGIAVDLLMLKAVGVDLADAVDGAHDELVHMTVDHQVCLLAKQHFDNAPYEFTDLVSQSNLRAQVEH